METTNLDNIQRTGNQIFVTNEETLVSFVIRSVQIMVEKRQGGEVFCTSPVLSSMVWLPSLGTSGNIIIVRRFCMWAPEMFSN